MSMFYSEITCRECQCNSCRHASNGECDPCDTCNRLLRTDTPNQCKGYTKASWGVSPLPSDANQKTKEGNK